ncbi:MAG: hypothetical protein FWH38_02375, partial [Treponema sp.]|nr:hypothetical protein [Treponema sp.]
VTGGSFTISGGEISGNTSYFSSSSSSPYGGGGVYADTAYFSKTGGIIYGYDSAESKSNIVKSGSGAGVILTNRGSAIYATSPDEVKRMEDNAEPGAFLLFDGSVNPPVWSGDWDY